MCSSINIKTCDTVSDMDIVIDINMDMDMGTHTDTDLEVEWESARACTHMYVGNVQVD